jgi:hypothetical protein
MTTLRVADHVTIVAKIVTIPSNLRLWRLSADREFHRTIRLVMTSAIMLCVASSWLRIDRTDQTDDRYSIVVGRFGEHAFLRAECKPW